MTQKKIITIFGATGAQGGEVRQGWLRRPATRLRAHGSRTMAQALPRTFCPSWVAVSMTLARPPSSSSVTSPETSIAEPASSSWTGTGRVKRQANSSSRPGSPSQSVTTRAASAIVNMPWAMTSGRPTDFAKRSFQWMRLKSPEAPA